MLEDTGGHNRAMWTSTALKELGELLAGRIAREEYKKELERRRYVRCCGAQGFVPIARRATKTRSEAYGIGFPACIVRSAIPGHHLVYSLVSPVWKKEATCVVSLCVTHPGEGGAGLCGLAGSFGFEDLLATNIYLNLLGLSFRFFGKLDLKHTLFVVGAYLP
jgi:hypothetical protein